jgi:hypothetical protein
MSAQPVVLEVVNSELAFSNLSVKSGKKTAFLSWLSDSCLIYNEGKLVPGKPLYESLPDTETKALQWYPTYVVVPDEGDLAFSTGIYRLYSKDSSQHETMQGRFYSLWKKEGKGYKVVFDAGGSTDDVYKGYDKDVLINSPVLGKKKEKKDFEEFYSKFESDFLKGKLDRDLLPNDFTCVVKSLNKSTFAKATKEVWKLRNITKIERLGSYFCSSGKLGAVVGNVTSMKNSKPILYLAVFSLQESNWVLNALVITE